MKTREWLLEKLLQTVRELHGLRSEYTDQQARFQCTRSDLDEVQEERNQLDAELRRVGDLYREGAAQIEELESRIAGLAPQKQFRVFVRCNLPGQELLTHIESVASCNGVTDITVRLP